MTARDWVQLFAAVGHLALAALSLARGGRSALARLVALLCIDLFGFNFATLAHHVTGAVVWSWIDAVLTALVPPLALHVLVAFVGGVRAHARVLYAAYVAFGALALTSAGAFVSPALRAWVDSPAWPALLLAGWAPVLAYALALLVRYLVESPDPDEAARARIVLAALGVGGVLGTTDLLAGAGLAVPRLGALGTLLATTLLATAVFRFRLFDRDLSRATALYVGALAITATFAYFVVFLAFGGNAAALLVGALAVTILLVIAAREAFEARSRHRERVERFATLGRVSAQMTHDLKNPLAALVGAAQVLELETSEEGQAEFRRIMIEQARRICAIVDTYDRAGRVEPVRTRAQLNDVVARVVAAQRGVAPAVQMTAALAPDLPESDADADLVASALENLVRNAVEAMPEGGSLRVATRLDADAIVVSVEDTGVGMDARRAERAFDDFFTTKKTGGGLGLAFVRRVAQAHGGRASLSSRVGKGTTVTLRFPRA